MTEHGWVDFDGHRLAYRTSGEGPAVVLIDLYRRRADMVQTRVLSAAGWKVFQFSPLGYGYSDRVPGYAGERLGEQILRVLAGHDVEQFLVWGYSAAGAMALGIARSTPGVRGAVVGGFTPAPLTPGELRQLDRRLVPDHPSRSLWWWFSDLDWSAELPAVPCRQLYYWGSEDRQMAGALRSSSGRLDLTAAEFIELPGLDHRSCTTPVALERDVIPAVAAWLGRIDLR